MLAWSVQPTICDAVRTYTHTLPSDTFYNYFASDAALRSHAILAREYISDAAGCRCCVAATAAAVLVALDILM